MSEVEGKYALAAEIFRAALGESNLQYASTLHNWGYCLLANQLPGAALEKFSKAAKIRRRVLGENNPDFAVSIANLGLCFGWAEHLLLERQCFFEAYGAFFRLGFPATPDCVRVLNRFLQLLSPESDEPLRSLVSKQLALVKKRHSSGQRNNAESSIKE